MFTLPAVRANFVKDRCWISTVVLTNSELCRWFLHTNVSYRIKVCKELSIANECLCIVSCILKHLVAETWAYFEEDNVTLTGVWVSMRTPYLPMCAVKSKNNFLRHSTVLLTPGQNHSMPINLLCGLVTHLKNDVPGTKFLIHLKSYVLWHFASRLVSSTNLL